MLCLLWLLTINLNYTHKSECDIVRENKVYIVTNYFTIELNVSEFVASTIFMQL